MRIGFFGGSFDPIHFGHLNLAIELKERGGIDEVWFCPANTSPHKGQKPLSPSLRLQMAQLAIQDIASFKVIDTELKRPGPSYTVHTLKELASEFPQHEWFLILGEDALDSFSSWKDPEEILRIASLLIGSRNGLRKQETSNTGFYKIPNLDISSTTVRERLSKGLYCGHLVPAKVLDFINKNGLYS